MASSTDLAAGSGSAARSRTSIGAVRCDSPRTSSALTAANGAGGRGPAPSPRAWGSRGSQAPQVLDEIRSLALAQPEVEAAVVVADHRAERLEAPVVPVAALAVRHQPAQRR